MPQQHDLSDEQWLVLDLLMRARKKGVKTLNRLEVLNSPSLPQGAALKLTFAALTMPAELVQWIGQHDFSITGAGATIYNLRFGKGTKDPEPTTIADSVIYLPGPEHFSN